MKTHTHTHTETHAAPLFPCKGNLPKPKWRQVLTALATPAVRIHNFRNLRTTIVYDTLSLYDRCDESEESQK